MATWQYRVVIWGGAGPKLAGSDPPTVEGKEEQLNALGEEGFAVVGMSGLDDRAVIVLARQAG